MIEFIDSEYIKKKTKKNTHMNSFYLDEFQKCLTLVQNEEMAVFQSLPTSIDFRPNQLFLFDASITTNLQKIVKTLRLSYITKGSKMVRYLLTDFVYMKARIKLQNVSINVRIVKKQLNQDKNQFILIHLYKQFYENKPTEKKSPISIKKKKLISKKKKKNSTQQLRNLIQKYKQQNSKSEQAKTSLNIEKSQNSIMSENSQLNQIPKMNEKHPYSEQIQLQEQNDEIDYEKEEQEYLILSKLLKEQILEELKQRKRQEFERMMPQQELDFGQQQRMFIQENQGFYQQQFAPSQGKRGMKQENSQIFFSHQQQDKNMMSQDFQVKSECIIIDADDSQANNSYSYY